MLKRFLNKNLQKEKTVLLESLEGIGDILVFETKRRTKNQLILDGLKRLEEILEIFLDLKRTNSLRFENLCFSEDFIKIASTNNEEAQLRLIFSPEKHLVTFYSALNQILRIQKSASDNNNQEISRYACYRLISFLGKMVEDPGNDLFVKQVLSQLGVIFVDTIKRNDSTMFSAGINWYFNIIFPPNIFENIFNLNYLELFDEYFFNSIRRIISDQNDTLFKGLTSQLFHGFQIPSKCQKPGMDLNPSHWQFNDNTFMPRVNLNPEIQSQINELEFQFEELFKVDQFFSWIGKMDNLCQNLIGISSFENSKNLLNKWKQEVSQLAKGRFLFKNLLDIVFATLAYCLFKRKFQYISYLWEFKQPEDSDSIWVGHDLFPGSLTEMTSFFFKGRIFERKFDFWDDHHGNEKYYNQLFILMVGRILENSPKDEEGKFRLIEEFKLPKIKVSLLNDIDHLTKDLIKISKNIFDDEEMLGSLKFNISLKEITFNEKVPLFLQKIGLEAKKQLAAYEKEGELDSKKIEKFRKEVVEGFYRTAILREIFVYYNLFENKFDKPCSKDLLFFGLSQLSEKGPFLEEWYIDYVHFGDNFGITMGNGENSKIFSKLLKKCLKSHERDIKTVLSNFADKSNVIIFSINGAIDEFTFNSENFKSKWLPGSSPLKLTAFDGWFIVDEYRLPVFGIHEKSISSCCMLIEKNELGRIIQYSPLHEDESQELVKDILKINVFALSEVPTKIEKLIKKAPEWLVEKGDHTEQIEYLNSKALIEISERFEYQETSNGKGYIINFS